MIILLQYCGDREERAFCYMSLGQISEQEAQYALAMQYYSEGLKLGPEAKLVAYYLNNNMGSCLNAEKRYLEGERFCRAAIEIDSGRANAFRNLGISLEGQGDVVGAAWAYAEASGVNSSDVKAQRLLRRLIFANSKTLIPFVNTLLRESTAGTGH
jgi:tetratricopeptide (TPR) repeat protein